MNMSKKQRDIVDYVKLGVLAIVLTILIFYLVIPKIAKMKKDSFADEVAKYIKLTDDKYVTDTMLGVGELSDDLCVDIKDVIYTNSKNYTGVVIVKNELQSNVEQTNKYIFVSNGKYVYNSNEPYSSVDKDGILDAKYASPRYKNCKNYEKGKIY